MNATSDRSMLTDGPFEFADQLHTATEHLFVATVRSGIVGHDGLMDGLDDALALPSYFGRNWNALLDCLRDLHWRTEVAVLLVHEELPTLTDAELELYLEVLADAVEHWRLRGGHQLRVQFPVDTAAKVRSASHVMK